MSTSVGTLMIDMAMNVAKMQQDMRTVQATVDNGMQSVAGAANRAKQAFALLGVSLSVASFANWIKGALDTAAHLQDVSEKTGATASSLSALAVVGKLTGTSVDQIGGMMTKLSKNMAVANEESKGTGQAIKALGLNFDTFRKLSPDQQILAVAKSMDKFADGSGKSAIAMTLFGKAGAEALPFLHDLAEAGELNARVTDEQAAAADRMKDNMVRTTAALESWKRTLAMALLPALGEFAEALAFVGKETGGTGAAVKKLNDQNQITEWARTSITAITYVLDIFGVLRRTVMTVIEFLTAELARLMIFLGGAGEAAKKALTGDFSGAMETMRSTFRQTGSVATDLGEKLKKLWGDEYIGTQIRNRIEQQRALGEQTKEGAKAQLEFNANGEEGAKVAAKQADAYRALVNDIENKIGTAKLETAQEKALTDAQKLELDIVNKLTDGKLKLTKAQEAHIRKLLEEGKAALTARDAHKQAVEVHKAAEAAMGAHTAALQKEIDKQRQANATYGKTAEELEKLEIARLDEAAAIFRQQAALLATLPGLEQEAKWYAEQAEGLQELVRLKNEGIHVKAATEAAEAWKKTTDSIFDGLTDALFRAFESGKGFMDAFKSTLVNAFKTLILQPTIKAILAPIAGSMGGLMGGGSASAGTVGGSGGGGIMSSIGNAASMIGGMGSMLGAGVGYGLSWLGGSATLAGTLSGAGAMVSGGLAGGMAGMGSVMAGLGAVMGALAPIAAVVAILANNIGRHPKRTRERGVEGEVVGGDVDVQLYRRWQQSGGWFHDRREGTSYSNAPEEVSSAITDATKAIYDQMTAYTDVLGLPSEKLAEIRHTLKYSIGKTDEETAKNAEVALAAYTNALAGRFAKVLTPFQRAGEALSDTLSRLASIQSVSVQLNEFGGVFARIARLSVDAREELIGMAGGIEALLQKTQAFVGSYYTEGEQQGINARAIMQALSAAGINANSLTSKADYRALVESRDVTTVTGREQFTTLLNLAPMFATLIDSLGGRSLAEAAGQAPAGGALADMFTQAQVDSLSVQATATATTSLTRINTDGFNAIQRAIAEAQARAAATAAETNAILLAVAGTSAITSRLLTRWDADGQLSTTTALP